MGMIFQEYALVERLSVMENVLSGRLGTIGFWKSFLPEISAIRHRRGVSAYWRGSGSITWRQSAAR